MECDLKYSLIQFCLNTSKSSCSTTKKNTICKALSSCLMLPLLHRHAQYVLVCGDKSQFKNTIITLLHVPRLYTPWCRIEKSRVCSAGDDYKPETAPYRAPTFSLLFAPHGGLVHAGGVNK